MQSSGGQVLQRTVNQIRRQRIVEKWQQPLRPAGLSTAARFLPAVGRQRFTDRHCSAASVTFRPAPAADAVRIPPDGWRWRGDSPPAGPTITSTGGRRRWIMRSTGIPSVQWLVMAASVSDERDLRAVFQSGGVGLFGINMKLQREVIAHPHDLFIEGQLAFAVAADANLLTVGDVQLAGILRRHMDMPPQIT